MGGLLFFTHPLCPQDLPDVYDKLIAEFDSRTIHRSWYPWKTFYNRDFCHIEFSDITIFYGNNASGKTTLHNVIAEKLGLQRTSLFNTSDFFAQYCEGNGGFELSDKHGQYFLESPVILPLAKVVVVDQVPRSKVLREHAPLASGLDNIEDGVKYLSDRVFAPTVGKFYVRNNHLPLLISDVGWVRCHNFEVLVSLYKVTNNYPNNALIFNYLTNKVINIG
jgi:hypothetical protein